MSETLPNVQEGEGPILAETWCMDGSARRTLPSRQNWPSSLQPTAMRWTHSGYSSQWAKLWATWMVLIHEPDPICLCMDSQAVYKGLTLWMVQWAQQQWTINRRPLSGAELWNDIWQRVWEMMIMVYHVSAYQTTMPPGNQQADELAWRKHQPRE
ncbi:ribonuclease HI-like [Equus asinus]|uniref:ribonuclease HI-like n=1 Tax=Equus asinus TaxID=9793 RepID=UPI0038F6D0F4